MAALGSWTLLLAFLVIKTLLCLEVEGNGSHQDALSRTPLTCTGDEDCDNTGLPYCIEGVCGQCQDTGDCGNLQCRDPSDKVPFTVCGDPHVRVKVPVSNGGAKDLCFDLYGKPGSSFTYLNMNGVKIDATFAQSSQSRVRIPWYRRRTYRRQSAKNAIHLESVTMAIPGPSVVKVNDSDAEVTQGNFTASGGTIEAHSEGWRIQYGNFDLKVYRGKHGYIDFTVSLGEDEISKAAIGVMGIVSNEAKIQPWTPYTGNLYFGRSRVPDPIRWNGYKKCFSVSKRSYFMNMVQKILQSESSDAIEEQNESAETQHQLLGPIRNRIQLDRRNRFGNFGFRNRKYRNY